MDVYNLTPVEYKDISLDPGHVFNSIEFNVLTAQARGIELACLGFKAKKYKLGIIGSITDQKFRSPFSAPFGGFSYANNDLSLETIDQAVSALIEYLKGHEVSEIEFVMPPLFYNVSFLSKLSNTLYRQRFEVVKSDLNHSFHLDTIGEDYLAILHYNAKKNLNIALGNNFEFIACKSLEEKELAYGIIKENREAKGYPLRMDFDVIRHTIGVVKADFFLVKLDADYVAAAMVFHVTDSIVQVVYWGDLPQYSSKKTMNYLSYSVVKHYQSTHIRVIDIGPSTENSIPKYGLCDFKESIGCTVYPKQAWALKL